MLTLIEAEKKLIKVNYHAVKLYPLNKNILDVKLL